MSAEPNYYNAVLIATSFSVLCAVCVRIRRKMQRYRQLSLRVPSVTRSFWAEILFAWSIARKRAEDLLPYFTGLVEKNGPVVHFNLCGVSCIILNDPDDIKVVLSSKEHITKGPAYDMLKPWLNESLLLSSGPKWKSRRKLLTNAFHFKSLNMYIECINNHSRVLFKKLLEASAGDKEISVMKYVKLCSLDIICETIMGTEMKAQEGESVQYVECIQTVCRSLIDRVYKIWLRNDLIYRMSETGQQFHKSVKILHDYTDNIIKQKRQILNDKQNQNAQSENGHDDSRHSSLLDILIGVVDENPDQMTDTDIREEVDTFLFAGHDTSSIAITMTLLLLGMYPDVQNRARDELRSIFGDSDRDVTMEDLNAMQYVEAVIKETLRIYPSVPGIARKLQETLKLKNYTIPPETIIAIYPYILHRSEDIYPNSGEFIPERFLDEANKSKFLSGYIPFSSGPRNCIGQKYAWNEMKIVISNVLRKAKIETLGSQEDIHIRMEVVIGLESIPKMRFYEI